MCVCWTDDCFPSLGVHACSVFLSSHVRLEFQELVVLGYLKAKDFLQEHCNSSSESLNGRLALMGLSEKRGFLTAVSSGGSVLITLLP